MDSFKFLVIEVYEREIASVHFCRTKDEAVETANSLLADHCDTIGCTEDYETANNAPDGCIPYEIQKASVTQNAWCNLKDDDWDAFIIDLSIWQAAQ